MLCANGSHKGQSSRDRSDNVAGERRGSSSSSDLNARSAVNDYSSPNKYSTINDSSRRLILRIVSMRRKLAPVFVGVSILVPTLERRVHLITLCSRERRQPRRLLLPGRSN